MSNPAEVAKTRLQLQGELVKTGYKPVYFGPLDVLNKAWKFEGLGGVQRGLGAAVAYSVSHYVNAQHVILTLLPLSECPANVYSG